MVGLLRAIVKLDPWASRDTWASVRGTPDTFFTNSSNCSIVVVVHADANDFVGEVDASDVIVVVAVIGAMYVCMYDVVGSLSGHL